MARAIPLKLLIHNIVLKRESGKDRDRNPVFNNYEIKNVRVVLTKRTVVTQIGETKADEMKLFIDAKNSTYWQGTEKINPFDPQELDEIVWDNKTYTIRSVAPYYTQGSNELHHYEASLE